MIKRHTKGRKKRHGGLDKSQYQQKDKSKALTGLIDRKVNITKVVKQVLALFDAEGRRLVLKTLDGLVKLVPLALTERTPFSTNHGVRALGALGVARHGSRNRSREKSEERDPKGQHRERGRGRRDGRADAKADAGLARLDAILPSARWSKSRQCGPKMNVITDHSSSRPCSN
ncbi:unnamed protein product [Rhizoctonia solani]|nr:unnamed protein product [Rhizoctonia solani]